MFANKPETYSYHEGKDPQDIYAIPEYVLSSLITAFGNGDGGFSGGETNNGATSVDNMFNQGNYDAYEELLHDDYTNPAKPRSYINYVVFNENMEIVLEQSGAMQVSGTANSWELLEIPSELVMKQNGYIAVYISNEQHQQVWFDNVTITQTHGTLQQEQHYYPHGLQIWQSNDNTTPRNKFSYQGNESRPDIGLNLSNFNFRQYDQQIGLFTSVDPLADASGQQVFSPYHFCGNDPVNFIDPLGLEHTVYSDGSAVDAAPSHCVGMNIRELARMLARYNSNFDDQSLSYYPGNAPQGNNGGSSGGGSNNGKAPMGYQANGGGGGYDALQVAYDKARKAAAAAELAAQRNAATQTAQASKFQSSEALPIFMLPAITIMEFVSSYDVSVSVDADVSVGIQAGYESHLNTPIGRYAYGVSANAFSVEAFSGHSSISTATGHQGSVNYIGENYIMKMSQGFEAYYGPVGISYDRTWDAASGGGPTYNDQLMQNIYLGPFVQSTIIPLQGQFLPVVNVVNIEIGQSVKFLIGIDVDIKINVNRK